MQLHLQEERLGAMAKPPPLASGPPLTEGEIASWDLSIAAKAFVYGETCFASQ